ncbi:PREDICTED: DNA-directed RNA polymerases II, IV and V subunit 8B-like [Nicotiana attenuata]|uniref:Dna-directed rna polymerases ii, iv and v subunit 8b n=1 Tax=Nicotiana attenuata TaxID=49451 RepID=A0A314KYQ2_NICAT|nr:PREDICTED: DNA-directed RNA polymerases II, IV and V subunit 8B-like [Nicotiana attenuata]XP_019267770.1 PREDICTED: DNA-directed RNA polymerases II, IV and V subunit 8B-like [Nicotiana attenuata]OIT34167.1 dna-directed rna polymerases ii, iv and v subunit 8b [Nicotiana attenuata]
MDAFHFDEIIKIRKVDADGKKYDKVSRIEARCHDGETSIQLDINSELYPMQPRELYRMVISKTLNMDGSAVTSHPPEGEQKSLADKFEYIVHGLVYKVSMDTSGPDKKVVVYVSFGGLQLMLKSDPLKVQKFKLDEKLYLLLRKMTK